MITKATRKRSINKSIAVDVDGTLLVDGKIDTDLLEWCKKKRDEGFTMILWSQRGEIHARKTASMADAFNIFHYVISKPGYIVDDKGWTWTKFTRRVTKWQKSKS